MTDEIYDIDTFLVPYGYGRCRVDDCPQMVQNKQEFEKHGKMSFCYAHAKMRDGLFDVPWKYTSDFRFRNQTPTWDLAVSK